VYSGLSRETALPVRPFFSLFPSSAALDRVVLQFYERAWPQMLHAVATLLKASDPHMLRAMDGLSPSDSLPSPHRSSPASFFWVVFGLAFESLCTAGPSSSKGSVSTVASQSIALEAVVGLIRPDVAGAVLKEEGVFEEVANLCFRLAITEGPEVKLRVLEIALGLAKVFIKEASPRCVPFPSPLFSHPFIDLFCLCSVNGSPNDTSLLNDPRLTQCLRVATTVLREMVPATMTGAKRAFSLFLLSLPPRLTLSRLQPPRSTTLLTSSMLRPSSHSSLSSPTFSPTQFARNSTLSPSTSTPVRLLFLSYYQTLLSLFLTRSALEG
jgi:hypothetical protein